MVRARGSVVLVLDPALIQLTYGGGDGHGVEDGVLEPPLLLPRVGVHAGLDGRVQLVLEGHQTPDCSNGEGVILVQKLELGLSFWKLQGDPSGLPLLFADIKSRVLHINLEGGPLTNSNVSM